MREHRVRRGAALGDRRTQPRPRRFYEAAGWSRPTAARLEDFGRSQVTELRYRKTLERAGLCGRAGRALRRPPTGERDARRSTSAAPRAAATNASQHRVLRRRRRSPVTATSRSSHGQPEPEPGSLAARSSRRRLDLRSRGYGRPPAAPAASRRAGRCALPTGSSSPHAARRKVQTTRTSPGRRPFAPAPRRTRRWPPPDRGATCPTAPLDERADDRAVEALGSATRSGPDWHTSKRRRASPASAHAASSSMSACERAIFTSPPTPQAAAALSTSIRSASPWPPPEQIAASPSPPPLRRSS